MAVIIFPVGGVGNQLFIYAAGKALALKRDLPLLVDTSHYRKYEDRQLELDFIESNWVTVSTSQNLDYRLVRVLVQSYSWVRRLIRKVYHRGSQTFDEAFIFDPNFPKFCGNFWLRGYFQSWRYFNEIGEELRNEILDAKDPTEFFIEVQKEIVDAGASVAVHVRRGDYISNGYMGVLPEEYYERSLRFLDSLVGDFQIFVFSDDTDSLIDESFLSKWSGRMTVVRPSEASRPIETLRLIAMCDHVVMANSSFSWWGAWLGHRENRHVVYPRPWLSGGRLDDRDLVLPTWIGIGTEYVDTNDQL